MLRHIGELSTNNSAVSLSFLSVDFHVPVGRNSSVLIVTMFSILKRSSAFNLESLEAIWESDSDIENDVGAIGVAALEALQVLQTHVDLLDKDNSEIFRCRRSKRHSDCNPSR